jgi:hypothetical protein
MDTLADLHPNSLHLLIVPKVTHRALMTELVARLALSGPVRVLDGGNCFNLYGTARALGRQTIRSLDLMERIQIARAFTCYQMETLLADTPAAEAPTLVLRLLDTFEDENVSLPERVRLLQGCLVHLRGLSDQAPVVVSARSPTADQGEELLGRLKQAADQLWQFELPTPPEQPRLF